MSSLSAAASAPLACLHCRRLKMRCIGADNPPCVRCSKAQRECVVQPSRRGVQRHLHKHSHSHNHNQSSNRSSGSPSSPTAVSAPVPALAPGLTSARTSKSRRRLDLDLSDQRIPAVPYDYSPPDSADQTPASSSDHNVASHPALESAYSTSMLNALKPPEQLSEPNKRAPSSSDLYHSHVDLVADGTLANLVKFFRKKLVYFIPALDITDLDDIRSVVQHKRPLAYCASLVAANFVPGGSSLRQALIPHVANFLARLEGPLDHDDETIWTNLQAYAIIYAYRPSTDISNPSLDSEKERRLNHWRIKSAIEVYAMRLGLHRALDEVKALIHDGKTNLCEMPIFQKAMYWLWLFNMSHHFSLATETPPTLRQDRSIRMACSLLSEVPKPPRLTRVLAEVDLCMLWNLADRALPGLGEWWVAPPDDVDPEEATRVLDDADAALDVWSRRWGLHGETDPTYPNLDVSNNGAVDFHFRATRFWIRIFAVRIVHHQSRSRSSLGEVLGKLNVDLTLKSAEAAERCCRYLLDISPLRRDSARYMADLGFALFAYCAIYVIRIYELFGHTFPILVTYTRTVEALGKVLTEMAVGSNQIPLIYGTRVLERLAEATSGEVVSVAASTPEGIVENCHMDLHWVNDMFPGVGTCIADW